MNYRSLPEDREKQFQDYVHYAFSLEDGPQDEHGEDLSDHPGEARALFDGDRMLCVCAHYWFQTGLRGREFEMPGLSAVASPPEHRRQGYVTRLLAESLSEYRDRGDFLCALWAFEHPFYERQGWGLANKWIRYECDPDALAFARDPARNLADGDHPAGEFRQVEADEYDRLDSVLAADSEGYELGISRTEDWWRERVFSSWREDPYVYAWEKDGEIRGYLVYRVEDEDEGKRLQAEEFAAADHEASVNLLRFLANHDSQVETVSIYGPPDDTTLLDMADDPADIDCEVKPGPMVRLVDVPRAFEALGYPEAADAEFVLGVSDSLADWNDDTFRVVVEGGQATCEPTTADPDVRADVSTLSQVFVGYHSVEESETLGDFDVRSRAAREALSAMFPPRKVFLREGF